MRACFVVLAAEASEAPLLCLLVALRWPGGGGLEGAVHALVRPVLLRSGRCHALMAEAEPDPVRSKFPNALCSGQLPTPLGHVKPSRPAIAVNVKQELKQPIGDRCGIQPISQHTLLIGQREDGETCRRVVLLNGGLERVRAGIIAVCGEQDDLLTLTYFPHDAI
jgi:hypothetical protein